MAKKKTAPADQTPQEKKALAAAEGVKKRLDEKDDELTFTPNTTERTVVKYVGRRIDEMIDFRKQLRIEPRWQEADEEYIPHELDFGTTRKRFETDQDTGLRSRMVPVGDITQQWRQASSAPTLLAKIQTAVSILVENQPEADLVALLRKYEKTTDLAYALWKRNWSITNAKEKLKVTIFDLIKYGWAAQRTYPRTVKYKKRVLVEVDPNNPENDKYEEKELLWFNDVDRQNLNVYRTWVDELAKPYDPYSTNEAYYELDFSYDAAEIEFGQYPNFKYVKRDSYMSREDEKRKSNRTEANEKNKKRKDVVTIGFFESRHKDLFMIWVPKDKIVIYVSPLPNDDGYLSVTHTMWLLRKSGLPYGVSLWEIIRQNKALYDKMKNMTMDQLVLSIMKFGFFSGTNTALGDGKVEIIPGQARQLTSSTGKPEINWMEIPGPGQDAWKGLEAIASMMDDESGISPTLEGEITGKTLGEILHAKEAALKRLKVPLDNIAWLIEQDAYLTLSWMSQIYSIPTVMEFTNIKEMLDFEREEQINHVGNIFGSNRDPETGALQAPFKAQYYPQLALHLENSDGQLFSSKESQFYQVGKDILPGQLKWKGIFKVIPRSIIDTSQDLIKAMKMEVFNIIIPLLQFPPELVAKSVAQILRVNEEDPDDWLPDMWLEYLENGTLPALPGALTAQATGQGANAAPGGPQQAPGAPAGGALPAPASRESGTIQGGVGLTPPQAATVVPGSSMPSVRQLTGGKPGGVFTKRL